LLVLALTLFCREQTAHAYIEAQYSLGRLVAEANWICVVRVEKVDKERNLIIYSKVRDLKGKHNQETIKHNIGRGGFHEREWKFIMEWAEPGKIGVFMHNGQASETCIDNYWYQAYAGGEWWNMSHGEPYLLRSFCGKPEKFIQLVEQVVAGQEVITTCMVDGDKNALQLRTAKIQRMKASLAKQDYNAQRDFAGWGGDEFRALLGMPGFSLYGSLTKLDQQPNGIATADFDGDGAADVCLFSEDRTVLLKSAGKTMEEVSLPYSGGSRSASFADYNGDKKLDLLLATPTGPKLLTNTGAGFKDDSALLPKESYYNCTAAAFIDQDGDSKPDILLANGFLGLRLYHNRAGSTPAFEDISEKVGLGLRGVGGTVKGDRLLVADVNGDGRPDFLYSGPTPLLALNTDKGFVESKDSGLAFAGGKITPAFGDYNGDKSPDLFIPSPAGCKLFKNDGKGHFTDATPQAGDLAKGVPSATCAVFVDFNKTGKLDLLIGCTKGSNRYFKNNGAGAFTDATESLGLQQKSFNTRALAVADLNKDGVLDLALTNEGQECAVLIGASSRVGGK
jgi:hypothetical protein